MKNFKICNNDLKNWIEADKHNATEVLWFIKQNNLQNYTIDWRTPITGEYEVILRIENGKKVYQNSNFRLPICFGKIK